MNEINDGGPAFPWGEHGTHLGGMSLRDYFAAKVMQALITGPELAQILEHVNSKAQGDALQLAMARNCYSWADAMLKARQS